MCYVDPLGLYEESMIFWDGEIVSVTIMSVSEYNDSKSANENRESSGTTQLPTTQPAESDATGMGQNTEQPSGETNRTTTTAEPQNTREALVATIDETQKNITGLTIAAAALFIVNPAVGTVALTTTGAAGAVLNAAKGVATKDAAKAITSAAMIPIGAAFGRLAVSASGLAASKFSWNSMRFRSLSTGRYITTASGSASAIVNSLTNELTSQTIERSLNNIGTLQAPLSPVISIHELSPVYP